MSSNYLFLHHPLLLLPSVFPNIRVFSSELAFLIRWPKYWRFDFSISKVKSLSRVRLFVTPWTACSLPGSSVHGIFQARILEWVAMPRCGMSCHASSKGSSQPKDRTRVSCNSCIAGRVLTTEPLGKLPMSHSKNKTRTHFP